MGEARPGVLTRPDSRFYISLMVSEIQKRSVTVNGRKTSISIEADYWSGLRDIAEARCTTVSRVVSEIDREHSSNNLSSSIRVFVLRQFRCAPRPAQAE